MADLRARAVAAGVPPGGLKEDVNVHELNQVATVEAGNRPVAQSLWIESSRFDLLFFILSPLVAVPVLIFSPQPSLLSLAFGCVLGIPHYLSTLTFFFWDETRAKHRADWARFSAAPSSSSPCCGSRSRCTWRWSFKLWSLCGTRTRCAPELRHPVHLPPSGRRERPGHQVDRERCDHLDLGHPGVLEHRGASGLHHFMVRISPHLPQAVWLVAITAAAVSLVRLARSLFQRFRSSAPPRMPELAFLATSLLLFHPYL
jgi:hypothetical protein